MDPETTRPETATAIPTQQPCPQCQATLPVHQGYVIWCEACGWNLKPLDSPRPQNIFESFYARMGQRSSKGLFERLSRAQSLQPTLTPSKILAFIIAALVHGLTLAVLAVGLFLIVRGWSNCFVVGVGVLGLLMAWTLRPAFPQLDKEEREKVVPRSTCPTLYALTDQIAAALHARPIETIVIDEHFNASFKWVGWRRQPILTLGLPILAILDGQELVALLGHELGHGVNGDSNRGFFVGTAINSLIHWYIVLRPASLFESFAPVEILALPLKVVMLGVALVIAGVIDGLVHLLWRDSQRAEYLADALGAQVAGTDANLALLGKMHYQRTFYLTVQQMSLRGTGGDLFAAVRQQVAQVPERELERVQRIEQMHNARFDTTHPPTTYRRAFLRAHPTPTPQVTLSAADFARIRQELAAIQAPIQAELFDRHQRSLYY